MGAVKDLQGVNCGPLSTRKSWDLTAWYRRMRISSVRTHDFYGPCDLPELFPDQAKDPKDPKSYNFKNTDRILLGIYNAGISIFLRIGTSWNHSGWRISNLDKMAEVSRRIVLHYNKGWANGFHLGIKHVEIWNEPNGWRFWNRSASDFYYFYKQAAGKIKSDDPTVRIGACGVAGNQPGAYREGFISYCAKNKAPLDFFSWHRYGRPAGSNPYAYFQDAKTLRSILDSNNFKQAVVILSEWNAALGRNRPPILGNIAGAAYSVSALTYLQDTTTLMAHHYRGDVFGGPGNTMGLFDDANTLKHRGWGYVMTGRMLLTPVRVKATGSDKNGFTILAGRDGRGRVFQVLVSDYPGSASGRWLNVKGLPAGNSRVLVERWGMDAGGGYRPLEAKLAASRGSMAFGFPRRAFVHLLRIKVAGGRGPVLSLEDPETPWEGVAADILLAGRNSYKNLNYIILFSLSGSSPGVDLPGGIHLPLNPDSATSLCIELANSRMLRNVLGSLDKNSTARCRLDAGRTFNYLAGKKITVAGLLFDGRKIVAATNHEDCTIK